MVIKINQLIMIALMVIMPVITNGMDSKRIFVQVTNHNKHEIDVELIKLPFDDLKVSTMTFTVHQKDTVSSTLRYDHDCQYIFKIDDDQMYINISGEKINKIISLAVKIPMFHQKKTVCINGQGAIALHNEGGYLALNVTHIGRFKLNEMIEEQK